MTSSEGSESRGSPSARWMLVGATREAATDPATGTGAPQPAMTSAIRLANSQGRLRDERGAGVFGGTFESDCIGTRNRSGERPRSRHLGGTVQVPAIHGRSAIVVG